MITMNGNPVEIGSFPDGTILMKQGSMSGLGNHIEWKYENDRELLALIYLVKHLHSKGIFRISLYMPYIPNARQDRVKNPEDVFTLKYFTEILNSLDFFAVRVLDPHSDVSTALINNVWIDTPREYVSKAVQQIPDRSNGLLYFYPDNGAAKKYADIFKHPHAFGIKKRHWETGKILGLDIVDNGNEIAGKDILIIDDICSRGGTFYHAAKKLKELGANKIYLYVSHCENTILEGELLTSGLIEKVFTTDSIFTKEHEKIEVLK